MTSKINNPSKSVWIVSFCVGAVFIGICYFVVIAVLQNDGGKRKREIQTVTLIKPPPPPKIEEKPPEPEIKEEEEIIDPEPEMPPEAPNEAPTDEPPAGDNLGVDAEGTGGGDAFGLLGKKGGRALLGGTSDRTLMQRYGWYTQLIQEQIRKKIKAHMAQNGGVPKGDYKAIVQIDLDGKGRIIEYKLYQSSGNEPMDQALKDTLLSTQIDETPPEGMPKTIRLKISSRG